MAPPWMRALTFASKADPTPRVLDGVDYTFSAEGNDLIVKTGEKDPLVPELLSSPQLVILSEAAYEGDTVDPIGHGTGPFELASNEGSTAATLNAYADYWGEAPKVDGINAEYVPDATARSAALRTGAHVVQALPVGSLTELDPENVIEIAMPRTDTLHLNTKKGPFADPAVRAAAAEAIEKGKLVDTVYEGHADEAVGLLGPALGWAEEYRDQEFYKEEIAKRVEPASPEEIKGIKITLATYNDRAELPEVAVQLEQQLEAAGFEVEQEVREYNYIETDALDGKFDAFILSRGVVLDSGDPVAFLSSDYTCDGSYNLSHFCDPEVDALVDEAAKKEAGGERREAIMAVEAALMSRTASIPLAHERGLQGEANGVKGVQRDPLARRLITEETTIED